MEHSPSWETHNISAGQDIPRPLWNKKVYYHATGSHPESEESSLYPPGPKVPFHIIFHLLLGPKETKPNFANNFRADPKREVHQNCIQQLVGDNKEEPCNVD